MLRARHPQPAEKPLEAVILRSRRRRRISHCRKNTQGEILRFAQNDSLEAFFRSLIHPGPLATFPKWKEPGRFVKKGEKALTLCMPLTCKRTKTVKKDDGTDQEEEFCFTHFTYKAH